MRILLLALLACALSAHATDSSHDERWQTIKIKVASITDLSGIFSRSIRIFRQGDGVYKDINYEFIEGNADSIIKDTETIHILGDLNSNVHLKDHSELIIAGNVNKKSIINVSGISRIFIGGTLFGSIISTDSSEITILGNHSGTIRTGDPSTKLTIHGDFNGKLSPYNEEGSLLTLNVFGYTDINKIKNIYKPPYTLISGAFTLSNTEPGIYYPNPPYQKYYAIISKK